MTKENFSLWIGLFLGIICHKERKIFRGRNYKNKFFLRTIIFIITIIAIINIIVVMKKNTIETKEVSIVKFEVLLLKEELQTDEAELPTEEIEPPTDVETEIELSDIDEENLYWLAHGIYGENGHMSYQCQLYTGLVIYNRWKDSDFPSTIKDVLFADGQYAIVNNGRIYNEPSEEVWQLARDILSGNTEKIPDNVVYQAGFKQGTGVFAIVDGEHFCYK